MERELFAHWNLDEASGDTVVDASGNGHHGKLAGAVRVKGRVGGALYFDGDRARVDLNAGNLPVPWTAALWVKREDSHNPTARLLDAPGYLRDGSSLRLEQSTYTRRVGLTRYKVDDRPYEYSVPEGVWTHLAFVGSDRGVTLYANGMSVGTLTGSAPLSVGTMGSHAEQSLRGTLDDLRLYARALLPEQIEELHQRDKQ